MSEERKAVGQAKGRQWETEERKAGIQSERGRRERERPMLGRQ